jgi:hypothetical protein
LAIFGSQTNGITLPSMIGSELAAWANASIMICDYDGERLIGLPHLSRYQLLGDPKRDQIIRDLIQGR